MILTSRSENHSVINLALLLLIVGTDIPIKICPINTNSNQVLMNDLRKKPTAITNDASFMLKEIPIRLSKKILGIEHRTEAR